MASDGSPANVSDLRHVEPVEVDADRLDALCRGRGADAELEIADMLAHLDRMLELCAWEYANRNAVGLARAGAQLHELASLLGMVTLERAALGVLDCLAREETTALAACAARMFRVGEACEHSEWSLEVAPPHGGAPA